MSNIIKEDFEQAKSLLAAFRQNTIAEAAQPKHNVPVTERAIRSHWKIENHRIIWVTGWTPPTPSDRWTILAQASPQEITPGCYLPGDHPCHLRWNPQLCVLQQPGQIQQPATGGGVQRQERPRLSPDFKQELLEQQRDFPPYEVDDVAGPGRYIEQASAQTWLKLFNNLRVSSRPSPKPVTHILKESPKPEVILTKNSPTVDGPLSPAKNIEQATKTPTKEPKNKQELVPTPNPPTLASPQKDSLPIPSPTPEQPEDLETVPNWSKIKDPTKNRRRKLG